jgi:hypothetical protein
LRTPLAPDPFEAYGELTNFIRTNRAGRALQGVSGALERGRVGCLDGGVQRCQPQLTFVEELAHDPRDGIRLTSWLQAPQLDQPGHIDRLGHVKF